jgi:hypothetical protein
VKELLPGLFHWTAHHERIGMPVSSHYLEPSATLIDPTEPEGGVEALQRLAPPREVVLSCRHHARASARFAQRFGTTVHCNEAGLHELEGLDAEVRGFTPPGPVVDGVEAIEVGAISPDETALWLSDVEGGAVLIADALLHYDGELAFVPDSLMGDDPEGVKVGLTAALARIADREPATALFAHGDPIVGDGAKALRTFLSRAR